MKQTAVEWLIEQVEDFYCLLPSAMIEQAKAIEKEQIIEARADVLSGVMDYEAAKIDAQKYYNETYNK